MRQEYSIFILSLQFLTRIPVRSDDHYSELRMAEIPRYFPLVGALIGTAGGAVFLGCAGLCCRHGGAHGGLS